MTDKPKKKKSRQQVFTLLVEVGRMDGDGLPKGATGAILKRVDERTRSKTGINELLRD